MSKACSLSSIFNGIVNIWSTADVKDEGFIVANCHSEASASSDELTDLFSRKVEWEAVSSTCILSEHQHM